MFRRRSLTLLVGMATAVTLLSSGVAGAEPALEDGKYCATLLAKGKPDEESRIISRECSDTPLAARSAMPADSTWLGTVDEHEYGQGDEEMFFGDSGPCDAEGYRVDWIKTSMQNKTSSFLGWNYCNYVILYDNSHVNPDAGQWGEADPGSFSIIRDRLPAFNDRASSLRFKSIM